MPPPLSPLSTSSPRGHLIHLLQLIVPFFPSFIRYFFPILFEPRLRFSIFLINNSHEQFTASLLSGERLFARTLYYICKLSRCLEARTNALCIVLHTPVLTRRNPGFLGGLLLVQSMRISSPDFSRLVEFYSGTEARNICYEGRRLNRQNDIYSRHETRRILFQLIIV